MIKRFQIRVSGRVQGVFFRKNAQQKARTLTLKGFVRNEPDGSVYIEAEGEEEQLHQLIEWCKKGPPLAMVADVMYKEIPVVEEKDFKIV